MSDDLVKRLRDLDDDSFVETMHGTAADRIEELEAKLAKMVEALDNVVKEYDLFRKYEYERGLSSLDDEIEDARSTLAELKEQSND